METIIVLLAYTVQIVITLGIIFCLTLVVFFLEKRFIKERIKTVYRKYFIATFIGMVVVVCSALAYVAYHPYLTYAGSDMTPLTEQQKEDVLSYNKGIYSKGLPLISYKVTVFQNDQSRVGVKTEYLYFGDKVMSYVDGIPAIEKAVKQ